MKILPLSDIHLESGVEPDIDNDFVSDADVIVLDGDIHSGTRGLDWAANRFAGKPIIYVPGNHEYWGSTIEGLKRRMQEKAAGLGIHLLDDGIVDIQGVRFIGSTLWADFRFFGNPVLSMAQCATMPDFRKIRCNAETRFTPEEMGRLAGASLRFLEESLAAADGRRTVVVTHYLPADACVAARYRSDPMTAAFVSAADALTRRSNLWICGHTHDLLDLPADEVHGTIFCNPCGYTRFLGKGDYRKDRGDAWHVYRENDDWQPILLTLPEVMEMRNGNTFLPPPVDVPVADAVADNELSPRPWLRRNTACT